MNKKTPNQQPLTATKSRIRPGLMQSVLIAAVLSAGPVVAGPVETAPPSEPAGMVSVLDVAPESLEQFMRYPKWYGDPDLDAATIDGPLWKRQYFLGSLWGTRDSLADHGLVVDLSVTQIYQGTVSGDGDGGRYSGSVDLWTVLDTGRANLWPGGLIYTHFEANWGQSVTGTGAVLPLNMDGTMPGTPASLALSEFYLSQALPSGWNVVFGKIDWTAYADMTAFASNERTQFLYTGLKNDPILGAYVPYTSLGVAIAKQFNEEWSAALIASASNTKATSPGFDNLSAKDAAYGLYIKWNPKFGDLPGHLSFLGGVLPEDQTNYNIDPRHLLSEIAGEIPIATKPGTWALTWAAHQYVWADPTAKRHDGTLVGFGPFARLGIAPKDRSAFDQFYSVGLGGFGGPFGRVNDNWGIGWAGSHVSGDLRRDAAVLGFEVDDFEHVVEVFYNISLTPAAYLTLDAQYIDSANSDRDEAVVLATRLQLDF